MGYRFDDNPPKPEDMLKRFDVRNGAKMRLAFGCYYAHMGHDPKLHDHLGWPSPGHKDDMCQMLPAYASPWAMKKGRFERPISFDPINLKDEGYTEAYVSVEDEEIAADLDINAWIDDDDESIVRMTVLANLPTFSDKPKTARFTLFIKKPDNLAVDAVCHGIITILPGSPS